MKRELAYDTTETRIRDLEHVFREQLEMTKAISVLYGKGVMHEKDVPDYLERVRQWG